MTDAEWHACDEPDRMLAALGDAFSDRKMLLYACGCLRAVGRLLPPTVRGMIDGFDKVADGAVGAGQRKTVLRNLAAALGGDPVGAAAFAYGLIPLGAKFLGRQVVTTARAVELVGPRSFTDGVSVSVPPRHAGQAALLREIHGPTFVRTRFDQGWRTPTIDGLVRTIYEGQEYDRLPILADALEELGVLTR